VPILNASLDRVQRGAVFSGHHIKEQREAPVTGGVWCPAGAGRHQWGFKVLHHVLFYGNHPRLQHGALGSTVLHSTHTAEPNGHPCPKPLPWMRWLVELASVPGETVLDPFMGSGTTGVACVERGRRFVGIEIDPGYFRLACQRLAQAAAQGQLFATTRRPQQLALGAP
jgi:DNA modification methylase